MKTLQTAF